LGGDDTNGGAGAFAGQRGRGGDGEELVAGEAENAVRAGGNMEGAVVPEEAVGAAGHRPTPRGAVGAEADEIAHRGETNAVGSDGGVGEITQRDRRRESAG
jgi:hypothetical protein